MNITSNKLMIKSVAKVKKFYKNLKYSKIFHYKLIKIGEIFEHLYITGKPKYSALQYHLKI